MRRKKPPPPPPSKTPAQTAEAAKPGVPAGAPEAVPSEAVAQLPPPPQGYSGKDPFVQPGTTPAAPARPITPPAIVGVVPPPVGKQRPTMPEGPPVPPPLTAEAATEAQIYYQVESPLRIPPYTPVARRPWAAPPPALQWTLTGIVIGPKRTAIISDGARSYLVEQGGTVRKMGGADIVAEEVGADYVRLRYRNRIVTLKLREGS